ncbi:Uncharacterised protein [Serratia proteamaculans]|nr:Uncharacterised protein [Serratia proteamaculans]CAI1812575.1 Uncharacterised protein [Serratia proteamaculans]CAI1840353.1 Uncharacterised protein [Serratia proteamaculans]
MGALFFSYFNDSMFWVVNRMMGIKDVKSLDDLPQGEGAVRVTCQP